MARSQSRSDVDPAESELLSKFIDQLSSKNPISLPRETILGAVSHYISTLPSTELKSLLEAISTSRLLWDTPSHRQRTREAISLGVSGALGRLASEPGSSKWWKWSSPTTAWLDDLAKVVTDSEGIRRMDMIAAILSATDERRRNPSSTRCEGKQRENLEDEAVMAIAEKMGSEPGIDKEETDSGLLCEMVDALDEAKVRILDTPVSHRISLSQRTCPGKDRSSLNISFETRSPSGGFPRLHSH